MSVEFVSVTHVRAALQRVHEARHRATEHVSLPGADPSPEYWQTLFEANASEILAALPDIVLPSGYVVRYRFFGRQGSDLLVRPFVARATTDVEGVRHLIDWHAAPDSLSFSGRHVPTQDVDLLYRHFSFPKTATGFFDYWLAMQELWASGRWTHSHVIASAAELGQITGGEGWELLHPVEAYEPAVVLAGDSARLAVLVQCPLNRFEINLEQIDVAADNSLHYAERILVAAGPRGYVT